MLKTNSKKARENVRAYILTDADYIRENYGYPTETATTSEVLAKAWDIFRDEYRNDYRVKRNGYTLDTFRSWAQGLALGSLFCYYYNRSAVEDLGNILEQTEEERNRFSESEAEELLTKLIHRELVKAWDERKRG